MKFAVVPRLLVSVLAATCVAGTVACAPAHGAAPPGAHLEIMQTSKLVLHGTAAPHPDSANCASPASGSERQYLQLNEDTTANFVLRPTGGVAVLHLEELASNRTWCVMTRGDASGATLPGEFPSGVYAITVEGSHSSAPMPYAVMVERL